MRARHNLIPVYYRLADDIKRQIEAGVLKDGDMIPTEGQLGELYGVSRMTVRQGLALLAEAGLIGTIKGKGTFVHRPKLSQLIIDLQDIASDGAQQHRYKLLGVKLARDGRHLAELGLEADAKAIMLKRVMYKDDRPVAVEEKYLPYLPGTPLLESQLEYTDFAGVVAKHQDTVPVRNDMLVSIGFLNDEQARLLDTEPGSPALLVKQIIYSRDNKPLGISYMLCHKDRFQLKATSFPSFARL